MNKKQAFLQREKVYRKLPSHLNSLGFEMSLLFNFNYSPNAESLKQFYKEYDKVRGK